MDQNKGSYIPPSGERKPEFSAPGASAPTSKPRPVGPVEDSLKPVPTVPPIQPVEARPQPAPTPPPATTDERKSGHKPAPAKLRPGFLIALIVVAALAAAYFLLPLFGLKIGKSAAGKSKSGIELVSVQGGTFKMGSAYGEDDEEPVHTVTLDRFYLGKYEVSQSEWMSVMESNPSHWRGENLPVESVSWFDALEFCNRLSLREGLEPCYGNIGYQTSFNPSANGYRLPTEAEWEFAARGGNQSQGFHYAGSNYSDEVAWHNGNNNMQTHERGRKKPNELGLYDLSGNVWEWCSDWYGPYDWQDQTNPRGAYDGKEKVFRGGSWNFAESYCSVSNRGFNTPDNRYHNKGFRLARTH